MLSKAKAYNYLFFSFFLIFLKLIPIGIETQPLIALIFALLILVHGKYDFTLIKRDVFFVYVLIFIILVYFFYTLLYHHWFSAFVDLLKYLVGPLIYLALRRYPHKVSIKTITIVVVMLSSVALFILLLPSVAQMVFYFIISRAENISGNEFRGISILTPEPSYFSVFEIILLIEIENKLSDLSMSLKDRKRLKMLKTVVIILTFLTKSVFGIFIAVLFLFPSFSIKKGLITFLGIASAIFIGFMIYTNVFPESRISQVISTVQFLLTGGDFSLLDLVFIQESSGGARIILNFFGFASIVQHPFGSGLGSFPSLLQGYGDYFELDLASHDVLSLADHIKFYPQTYLANLVNDIGVFAFILIPILFVNNDNSNKNFSSKKGICLLLMIFFQSQITSPAFWFVMAISKNNNSFIFPFQNPFFKRRIKET